jgi:YVTN family beta-propeller protein
MGNGPIDIAIGGGSIWVTNSVDGTVSRIDPATNDVHQIRVGGSPEGVGFGNGSVWSQSTPPRLRPATQRRAYAAGAALYGYGIGTAAVYRSSWCSVPSGLLPVLFELSDHAVWKMPESNAACV